MEPLEDETKKLGKKKDQSNVQKILIGHVATSFLAVKVEIISSSGLL
jgi:hypothetical protein